MVASIILAMLFYFFPHWLLQIDFDITNPSNTLLFKTSRALMQIAAVIILIDNLRLNLFGALRGFKDTQFAMYTSLFTFCGIGLISSYFLAFKTHLAATGIWWGLSIGMALGAATFVMRVMQLIQRYNENFTIQMVS